MVLYLPEVLLGVFLKDHLSDHVISLLKALQWPQGSPDKIVIPGNSLQATCALAFGYSSLCAFPLGRGGPVPAFFTVVSLCPALCLECHGRQINTHQWTKVRFYLWRLCFGHRPLTPLHHTVPIPTTVLTVGTPSARVWAGLCWLAHLAAGHRCPFTPEWAVIAVPGLHADAGILVARDFGWGLVHEQFLQRTGNFLTTQSQSGLGIFWQVQSPKTSTP